MYRFLLENDKVRHRQQWYHPFYVKPELLACELNQVLSWDLSTLIGAVKCT
jgi:hypothetical protein